MGGPLAAASTPPASMRARPTMRRCQHGRARRSSCSTRTPRAALLAASRWQHHTRRAGAHPGPRTAPPPAGGDASSATAAMTSAVSVVAAQPMAVRVWSHVYGGRPRLASNLCGDARRRPLDRPRAVDRLTRHNLVSDAHDHVGDEGCKFGRMKNDDAPRVWR